MKTQVVPVVNVALLCALIGIAETDPAVLTWAAQMMVKKYGVSEAEIRRSLPELYKLLNASRKVEVTL